MQARITLATIGLGFSIGVASGMAGCRGSEPNLNHCAHQDGDAACEREGPCRMILCAGKESCRLIVHDGEEPCCEIVCDGKPPCRVIECDPDEPCIPARECRPIARNCASR